MAAASLLRDGSDVVESTSRRGRKVERRDPDDRRVSRTHKWRAPIVSRVWSSRCNCEDTVWQRGRLRPEGPTPWPGVHSGHHGAWRPEHVTRTNFRRGRRLAPRCGTSCGTSPQPLSPCLALDPEDSRRLLCSASALQDTHPPRCDPPSPSRVRRDSVHTSRGSRAPERRRDATPGAVLPPPDPRGACCRRVCPRDNRPGGARARQLAGRARRLSRAA